MRQPIGLATQACQRLRGGGVQPGLAGGQPKREVEARQGLIPPAPATPPPVGTLAEAGTATELRRPERCGVGLQLVMC
jgi:hypothetical protein